MVKSEKQINEKYICGIYLRDSIFYTQLVWQSNV